MIVGASVRAMAESAAGAGFAVCAADLFGDRDLLRVASEWRRAVPYPDALPEVVAGFPPGPWLYTGGLENHPDVVAAIARDRPLAGASAAAIRVIRDPHRLRGLVEQAGLQFPDTRFDPVGLPRDGTWLIKPRRSAGGHGIRPWTGWRDGDGDPGRWLWQRRIAGHPCSASFLVSAPGVEAGDAAEVRLIGLSRQLIGRRWLNAKPFHWCGGVALDPGAMPRHATDTLEQLGRCLAMVPGLRGLIGVDLVRAADGSLTVLEINPRPTASMELFERTTGISLAAAQVAASGLVAKAAAPSPVPLPPWRQTWSKAVLFTPRSLVVDDEFERRLDALAADWSGRDGHLAVADLPTVPQTIPAGRPVCTVFAPGPSPAAAIRSLAHRANDLVSAISS